MSAAHDEDPRERIRKARGNLRPVEPGEVPPEAVASPTRESVELTKGSNGPKSEPQNVRWLRSRVGAGPLGWAFLRGSAVMRVTCLGEDGYVAPAHAEEDNGPATVAPLTPRVLSTKISDSYFVHIVHKSDAGTFKSEEWFPEPDCRRALDTPDQLPYLRPLRGVTHTPLPRAAGGMIVEPGYDDESGYLYHPLGPMPVVPTAPTREEVAEATARVRRLVAQFAWQGPHDEANYLGALLTPLLRLVVPPPYKMIAIVAHQRGSGKSLLAEVLRAVHGGTLRTWPGSEEELGKQITSVLTATTAPVCQIDNIRGLVRSAKLDALLTTREYTDRVLGTTNDTTMINDRLWVATGNNMVLGGDLDRRVVTVSIDPGVERPEDRTGFDIPDLGAHVREHRAGILGDLLTMIAAWDAASRPRGEPTSDSFGRWVAAVRGVLEVCGVPGTFDHSDSRSDNADPDAEDAAAFLAVIERAFGAEPWTAKDVTAAMRDPAGHPPVTQYAKRGDELTNGFALVEAFPSAARGKHWRYGMPYPELSKPLGYWIKHRLGAWYGGRRMVKDGRATAGTTYRIEDIAENAR
jgi:hypothetical protein